MADVLSTKLDPVEGLVNYTLFTKPYHTKILEVLVEYIHTDCVDVTIEEGFWLAFGMPDPSLLPLWGYTLEEGQKYFNCDFQLHQICNVNPSLGYFEIVGTFPDLFVSGESILVQLDQLKFVEFTVDSVETSSEDLITRTTLCSTDGSPPPDCQEYIPTDCSWTSYTDPTKIVENPGRVIDCGATIEATGTSEKTRIYVTETILPDFPSTGIISPTSCWTKNEETQIYQFKGAITFPSLYHVAKNKNCGGWGYLYGTEDIGGVANAISIIGGNAEANYIEIDNTNGVPLSLISSWESAYTYGVKVNITNSTANDGVYEVFLSHIVYEGTPLAATNKLRIYFSGNIPSSTLDGDINIVPWGYDEPTKCINQGQSLELAAGIAENMQITLSDNYSDLAQGWDMHYWDMDGFDGGEFTYTVAFS